MTTVLATTTNATTICNYANVPNVYCSLVGYDPAAGLLTSIGWYRVPDNGCDNLNEQGITNTYGFYCKGGGQTWSGGTVSSGSSGHYCIKNGKFMIFRANDMNACSAAGGQLVDFVRLNGGSGTIRLDPPI
jgi:uncharacterized membrane protein